MPNWGNVKVLGKNLKVVSHERVEDRDPDTYCNRGEHFAKQGKYIEAEQEYLKAVKFSGKDDGYVKTLLRFYYSTRREDFEQKANKLYHDWWWRQGENQLMFYFGIGILCWFICDLGFQESLVSSLLGGGPLFYGVGYKEIHHREAFISSARMEGMYLKWFGRIFFGVLWMLFWTTIGWGILYKIDTWGIARLINRIAGIGAGVGLLISFNKAVPILQDWVRQWKEGFFKNIFEKILRWGRIVGSLFWILLLINALKW